MSIYQSYTDEHLLQLLQNGDEEAFTSLFHRYAKDIYATSKLYLRDDFIAEETVQTVFLVLWERRMKMASVQRLKDYLFIIARNTIYNHFRKMAIERTGLKGFSESMPAYLDNADHSLQEKEYQQLVKQAVDKMPGQRKKIYLLAKEENLSYKEIAEKLHISPFTVKKQLSLANRLIRKHLQSNKPYSIIFAFFLSAAAKI